jgi:hypothetical protein
MGEAHSQQLAHMLVNQAVVDDPSNFAHGHDPLVAQYPQLVRDGRVIPTKPCSQITDT